MFDFAQQLSTRLRRLVAPRAGPRPHDRPGAPGASRMNDDVADELILLARVAMPNAEHGTCHVGAYVPSLRPTVYLRRGDAPSLDHMQHPSDIVS